MHGGPAPDVLVVAHGHILRAFTKRWLVSGIPAQLLKPNTKLTLSLKEWDMGFPFPMMMEPGAIGVLSYAHHNLDEPSVLIGMALPTTA